MNRNTILRRKRWRRQRKRRIMLVVVFALVLTMTILSCTASGKEQKVIEGIWVYDEYTKYEFDGKRNGCMYLDYLEYEYKYRVSGNKLSLDFKDERVHDCVYQFVIEKDVLKIIGKEGTTGGTYSLIKQ